MDGTERNEREAIAWRRKDPVRAVGVASGDQVPFVPDEREMAEGIRAARRVDAASGDSFPQDQDQ